MRLISSASEYGTEFGPTNVAIHAVNIAVELGGAGQAIELARHVSPGTLSPERQARYVMDLAQAHAMRRQIGEALHALAEAERIAPEEPEFTTSAEPSPATCSSSPACDRDPNSANLPNDSASCPSRPIARALPNLRLT
jgi:hypothetical protein